MSTASPSSPDSDAPEPSAAPVKVNAAEERTSTAPAPPVDEEETGEVFLLGSLKRMFRIAELRLPAIFCLALLAFIFFCSFRPQLRIVDMGWHVAQGRWMLENGAFLYKDIFNYPNANYPLINEYVLYQLLVVAVFQSPLYGPAVLSALIWVGIFSYIIYAIYRAKAFGPLMVMMLMVLIFTSFPRISIRPEFLTNFGTIFFMVWLLRYASKPPEVWWEFWPLAVLLVFWVNFHSGFILGLLILGLFAVEMLVREALRLRAAAGGKLSVYDTVRAIHLVPWAGGILFVSAACLVNPHGFSRIVMPFYHQGSFVIKSHTSEMHSLSITIDHLPTVAFVAGFSLMCLGYALRGGRGSYAYLVIAALMYYQTLNTWRHLTVAGFVFMCALLSVFYFSSPPVWTRTRWARVFSLLVLGMATTFTAAFAISGVAWTQGQWAEVRTGDAAMPYAATEWMKRPDIALDGKFINRSEVGGWLQYAGFDKGQSFVDTGFGKFPPAVVHLAGLIASRPEYLPTVIQRYNPDIALVGIIAANWPRPLQTLGWRLVFYHPTGSVFVRPGFRPDLPTVTPEQVLQIYRDFAGPGPIHSTEKLVMLDALGLHDYAFQKWMGMPESSRLGWDRWTYAMSLIEGVPLVPNTAAPPPPQRHQARLEEIDAMARGIQDPEIKRSGCWFRVPYLCAQNKWTEALALWNELGYGENPMLEATVRIAEGRDDLALQILQQRSRFGVNEFPRYYLLAYLLAKQGRYEDAVQPACYAMYFMPDDPETVALAKQILEKTNAPRLAAIIADPILAPLPAPVP